MQIHGVDIDLAKIGISFTPNEDQVAALDHLVNFLNDKDSLTTVLSGSAGTGKTSIVKILLAYIKKSTKGHVTLAAPTHKAKMVLSRLSNEDDAVTLHTLLKLKPNVNILEFDVKELQFLTDYAVDLFEDEEDIIIVDEGSMVNDAMYDLLIDRMNGMGKIIFIGDRAQIQPVKQGDLSKVFSATDYPGFELTKVERQDNDNPIMDTLIELRERPMMKFETAERNNTGLIVYGDSKEFLNILKTNINDIKDFVKNPFKNKILTYTNTRVTDFNKLVRRILRVDDKILAAGEIVMGYDTFSKNRNPLIYNGSEYVVLSVQKVKRELPFFGIVIGYDLQLLDTVEARNRKSLDVVVNVFLIDPKSPAQTIARLASTLENMRLNAIKAKSGYSKKTYWQSWYKLKESFITMSDMVYEGRTIAKQTIDYGYALTTHKSQGSTYENVFIDMKNILGCIDQSVLRQLQYVGLSRASKLVHLLE